MVRSFIHHQQYIDRNFSLIHPRISQLQNNLFSWILIGYIARKIELKNESDCDHERTVYIYPPYKMFDWWAQSPMHSLQAQYFIASQVIDLIYQRKKKKNQSILLSTHAIVDINYIYTSSSKYVCVCEMGSHRSLGISHYHHSMMICSLKPSQNSHFISQ